MLAARERPEFMPPPEPGLVRSIGIAVLAHVVLVLALSWGIKWKSDNVIAVEAELWSNTVQQAAPRAPEVVVPPPPPPQPVAQPQPDPQREAEIALERDRQAQAEARAREEEAERQRQRAERQREELAQKQEQARRAAEARREEQAKAEARQREEQAKAEQRKREEAAKADERRREEQAKAAREKQEEARREAIRKENMDRMLANANSGAVRQATGSAMQSSGPSANYAGRLSALFQRNVLYPGGVENISGNPRAIVQVTVSPTGEILNAKLMKSSGNDSWDDAAVRAVERTERIPADENGRFVPEMQVELRPKRAG
ncbi:MAG: hypothetical protein AVDCRST_MAG51-503 [uncultured Ramlibacter sp.]|uniref:TonB C-terminal domain-containing protein n=1 Tax=uncultured Ramlibacter sp. TaxID=260755 RepID=A0A6J4NQA0_9BURK|nr:MAG: hypothetical protein AVDCRST_MAG51-503 [uncultured Ramlibacter sp.]